MAHTSDSRTLKTTTRHVVATHCLGDALKWTDCCCDRQFEEMGLAGETSSQLLEEEEHVLGFAEIILHLLVFTCLLCVFCPVDRRQVRF